MKAISMTEWRSQPGERIIDVVRDRLSFLITKAGKAVAKLTPVDDITLIDSDGRIRGETPLTTRVNLGRGGY